MLFQVALLVSALLAPIPATAAEPSPSPAPSPTVAPAPDPTDSARVAGAERGSLARPCGDPDESTDGFARAVR